MGNGGGKLVRGSFSGVCGGGATGSTGGTGIEGGAGSADNCCVRAVASGGREGGGPESGSSAPGTNSGGGVEGEGSALPTPEA